MCCKKAFGINSLNMFKKIGGVLDFLIGYCILNSFMFMKHTIRRFI